MTLLAEQWHTDTNTKDCAGGLRCRFAGCRPLCCRGGTRSRGGGAVDVAEAFELLKSIEVGWGRARHDRREALHGFELFDHRHHGRWLRRRQAGLLARIGEQVVELRVFRLQLVEDELVAAVDQAIEFLKYHKLTFPCPEKEHLLAIKQGKVNYSEVVKEIENLLVQVQEEEKKSSLPENYDQAEIDDFIERLYFEQVVERKSI